MTILLIIFVVVVLALLLRIAILEAEKDHWRLQAKHYENMTDLIAQHFKIHDDAKPKC